MKSWSYFEALIGTGLVLDYLLSIEIGSPVESWQLAFQSGMLINILPLRSSFQYINDRGSISDDDRREGANFPFGLGIFGPDLKLFLGASVHMSRHDNGSSRGVMDPYFLLRWDLFNHLLSPYLQTVIPQNFNELTRFAFGVETLIGTPFVSSSLSIGGRDETWGIKKEGDFSIGGDFSLIGLDLGSRMGITAMLASNFLRNPQELPWEKIVQPDNWVVVWGIYFPKEKNRSIHGWFSSLSFSKQDGFGVQVGYDGPGVALIYQYNYWLEGYGSTLAGKNSLYFRISGDFVSEFRL